ncbi:MAG: GMC family oxidoreductase [Acidobacteria bacterium]|nr:GMC family oxidoreductase [Acidobacteriota bacterium]
MRRLKPVDVVIVGGGWTGLLMAKEITSRTALSVVVLERGPARKTEDYATTMDELDYAIRLRLMQNIAEETVTHRHSSADRAGPIRQHGSFLPGTGVGGAGEHWNGISYRFLPDVFTLATHWREKYGRAPLPEELAVEDWGVTYEELEPCYWRAEQMMGVSGKAGNLRGRLIEGGNVFEGPRSQEYPTPPLKSSYLSTLFRKAALDLGYHPYPAPAANLSESYTNPDGISRPGCAYCGYCERFGCMIGAKAQPTNTLLPVLARKKNFTLRTGCWARRVTHRDGRAEGVVYVGPAGEEVLQPAQTVVLASWTLNNTRLLLLSGIGEPYDAASGKGTLGKNLTHQVGAGAQVFLDKPLNAFMGSGSLGVAFADLDGDRALDRSSGVLRGGHFQTGSTGNRPIATFGATPPGEAESNWGAAWKKAALAWRDKVAGVGFSGEHLSYRQNYMDLDPTYTDKHGDRLLRLTLDWTEHERRQAAYGGGILAELAKALGPKAINLSPPLGRYTVTRYQGTHIQGGVIMGGSPERSVVNPYLQHWRTPNLWVVGASAFPQNGSGNPTLTVLALTYRAADAFVDRYSKRPGALL